VFRAKRGLTRFWEEISKNHRYVLLFTASGDDGNHKRFLTGMHLLTVQSMLMFILSVFYDLQVSHVSSVSLPSHHLASQYPSADYDCASFTTKKACLEEQSPFDSSKHLCQWVQEEDESVCQVSPVKISVKVQSTPSPCHL
jgi:hypothetical protein